MDQPAERLNGLTRVGQVFAIGASGLFFLGILGSVYYVAFSNSRNSDQLADQRVVNEKILAELRALQLDNNSLRTALQEIETQFCATDIVRNLMHASDQRVASLLWEKIFGTKYPTDNAYYPTICNRRTK